MKRLFLLAALCLIVQSVSAQQALGPGSGVVSPQINPDHTVTFRYHNPKAVTVQLTGDFLPSRPVEVDLGDRKLIYEAPGIVELREGPGGLWEYTSEPLDGEPRSWLWESYNSEDVEFIPENGESLCELNSFVPSIENNMLKVELETSNGTKSTIRMALRTGGAAK